MTHNPFIEALGQPESGDGLKWRIRVIRAGESGNSNFYPDAVLREATALFAGVRVFAKSDEEHIKGKGKDIRNLIGGLSEPTFVEGQGQDSGEIQATLTMLEAAGDIPAKIREAHGKGMGHLFGFSIDADGTVKRRGKIREAQSIKRVNSVDLIIEPGAGGELLNLIEAQERAEDIDMALRQKMIEAIQTANGGELPEGLDTENDDALETAYREALKPEPVVTKPAKLPADSIPMEELEKRFRLVEAKAHARVAIIESNLPELTKARLKQQFEGIDSFTEAQVDEAIKSEREYLAKLTESGKVKGLGEQPQTITDRSEQIAKMWDSFFDPQDSSVTSLKECYVATTGDKRVTGSTKNCDMQTIREACGANFREALATTDWTEVLGDSITRRMLMDYRDMGQYDVWRNLTNAPVPLQDFRTQRRMRIGGYGNLATVAQAAAYLAMTTPADEEATYAPAKRGGTETVSLESIRNDDVGSVRQLPIRMSRSAKRTLATFVLEFLNANPTIYDAAALFAAGHSNIGTTALSATTLAAGRLAMLQQTEAGSAARLGIPPRNLWVPMDLEETAFDLFRRQTNNDTDFVEALQMNVIPVWYWTDANNWYLSADPNDINTVEIGFLDGNEEPELFTQDMPNVGSMFTNDQLTWKIRHIYGGAVTEFRGLYGGIVA